jgi:hypothetical protein
MASRKDPEKKLSLEVTSTHKVHLTPLYLTPEAHPPSGSSYITLSLLMFNASFFRGNGVGVLPGMLATLPRKNRYLALVLLFCPAQELIVRPLSQHMIDIDAIIVDCWSTSAVDPLKGGESGCRDRCRLGIGKKGVKTLWMLFTLQLVMRCYTSTTTYLVTSIRTKATVVSILREFPLNDDSR